MSNDRQGPQRAVRVGGDQLAAILGNRKLHEDTFKFEMTGHRCLVLLDIIPETWRGIILKPAQGEIMGAGIVLACGGEVGYPPLQYPGGPICEPEYLLGKHVVFGSNAGRPLRLDFIRDTQYQGDLLVLADRDIWGVEWITST